MRFKIYYIDEPALLQLKQPYYSGKPADGTWKPSLKQGLHTHSRKKGGMADSASPFWVKLRMSVPKRAMSSFLVPSVVAMSERRPDLAIARPSRYAIESTVAGVRSFRLPQCGLNEKQTSPFAGFVADVYWRRKRTSSQCFDYGADASISFVPSVLVLTHNIIRTYTRMRCSPFEGDGVEVSTN